MDADARGKCYQHNRECRQNIERMLEGLISKHSMLNASVATNSTVAAPKEDGDGANNNFVGVAPCEGCGKSFKSNIARKKHLEKCDPSPPSEFLNKTPNIHMIIL